MGSSKKPKVQVSEYRMSLHLGFCYAVDYLLEIFVKEKSVWKGVSSTNQSIGVALPSLFGGVKKEGGLVGTIEVLHGSGTQVLPAHLASKLGSTSDNIPGFRDILSLFFHGGSRGFLWSANYPYLHGVWAKVSRTSSGWYPEKSSIGSQVSVDPGDYAFSASVAVPSMTNTYTTVVKVSGRELHYTEAAVAPGLYLGSPSLPYLSPGNSTYYVINLDTGAIVSTYTGPARKYVPSYMGYGVDFIDFADNDIKYAYLMKIDAKNLWLVHSPTSAYLSATSDGNNPGESLSYVAMDITLERVAGIALDQNAEVAVVLVSKPSTKTTRWAEVDYDGTVLRTGECSFYAMPLTGEPVSGVDVRYFGYGPSLYEYRTSAYNYSTWTLASCHTSVSFFQIDSDGVMRWKADTWGGTSRSLFFNGNLYVAELGSSAVTTIAPTVEYDTTAGPQMNPAHIIREVLTNNDWGLGISASMIDDSSFIEAADKLYDEGFGLSLQWVGQSSAEDFINDILSHIDATYGNDPNTGKFYIKLIRGGYDTSSLDELTDDVITITAFSRNSMSDTSNEVVVTWTNPENEEEQTVTVHDLANYSAQGVIISTSRNYHAVRTSALALRCAMRELAKCSQPIATFEIEANRMAYNYKSGDVVKITYPEYGLNGLPCRVMSVNRGKPGQMAVKMTLMEDVFDMPSSAYAESPGSGWEDSTSEDIPVNTYRVETAPYYFVAREIGDEAASSLGYPEVYAFILAAGPGAGYGVYTEEVDVLGNTIYDLQGTREYATALTLTTNLVKEVSSSVPLNGQIEQGDVCIIGNEICLVEFYSNGIATLRRGMLDTVPANHASGDRVWIFSVNDDLSDPEARSVGESINYKLVPEDQEDSAAVIISATMNDRPYRPYRPAGVRINGALWPTVVAGEIVLTWAHRNRLSETAVWNKWDDASVTPEPGTTYTVKLFDEDNNLVRTVSGISGTTYTWSTESSDCGRLQGRIRVDIDVYRDSYASLQTYYHVFDRAGYGLNYGNYYGGI